MTHFFDVHSVGLYYTAAESVNPAIVLWAGWAGWAGYHTRPTTGTVPYSQYQSTSEFTGALLLEQQAFSLG
eukprot:scaffold296_cov102-Amphora_coffeaeformis.AAC.3